MACAKKMYIFILLTLFKYKNQDFFLFNYFYLKNKTKH